MSAPEDRARPPPPPNRGVLGRLRGLALGGTAGAALARIIPQWLRRKRHPVERSAPFPIND